MSSCSALSSPGETPLSTIGWTASAPLASYVHSSFHVVSGAGGGAFGARLVLRPKPDAIESESARGDSLDRGEGSSGSGGEDENPPASAV